MNDNYLIEKVERDCPLCDKVHFVEKRKRIGEMLIKNEIVPYEEVYFFVQRALIMKKMSLSKLTIRRLPSSRRFPWPKPMAAKNKQETPR